VDCLEPGHPFDAWMRENKDCHCFVFLTGLVIFSIVVSNINTTAVIGYMHLSLTHDCVRFI